ncbi:MAG: AAA family ATPase [Pyrinomonadaceae bacterium]
MKLIFLHCLPGVGKLTVARELAELIGFGIFHNHLAVDLVESLFSFGSQPFVELREAIWLAAFSKAVEAKHAGLIFTFAYDRTVLGSFVKSVREVVESDGGEVLFVELRCTPEELEKRITHPSRQRFGKLYSMERFRELSAAGAFVDPGIPAHRLVVDTTELAAPEAAMLIVSRLGLRKSPFQSQIVNQAHANH